MAKKLTDKEFLASMSDGNSLFGNFGGAVGQITLANLRHALNKDDEEVLESLAFYIDVNKPSTSGDATRVDVGGNMGMRELWEDAAVSVLMDASGNYCPLNRDDNRFTADGEAVLNEDGTVRAEFAHGDFMKIIPPTYGRVQTVTVGATTIHRLWLSLVPLPGGYIIPQQVVGKFKCAEVGSALRSLPGKVPTADKTINAFFNLAQSRSKNHGLANLDFRNYLLFYMMSKYGWRDSQNCKTADGTLVWGVGLDGTEGLASGETVENNGFTNQKNVKTGHTMSIGDNDGKMAVTLPNGNTAHGVNVAGFENPWGQYWEMMGGICSVGTDVYCWRQNWMPTGRPTADTFANVEHVLLTRAASDGFTGMNIIASDNKQGVYMIPHSPLTGVSYGDNYSYHKSGQLWQFGGASRNGSDCGTAHSYSADSWSLEDLNCTSRLAYYGPLNKVTTSRFKQLAS